MLTWCILLDVSDLDLLLVKTKSSVDVMFDMFVPCTGQLILQWFY